MEKISVIVPVYNVEKYLEQCIESIVNQTYKNIEIILIDDGSKDNSGKICDKFAKKDKRIKVIHKENEGVSIARNIGMKNSRGKYIAFIDADDHIEEKYIENLHKIIKDTDMAISGSNKVDEYGKIIEKTNKIVKEYNKEEAIQQLLLEKEIKPEVWGKLFKSELLKKLQFRRDMTIGEDFELIYKYFLEIQKVQIDTKEALYNYVVREGSAVNSAFNSNWFKDMQVCEEIINKSNDKKTKKYAIKRCIRSDLMCAIKILKDINPKNSDKNEEYLKMCKNQIKKYGTSSYYKANIRDKIKIFLIANYTPLIKIVYYLYTKIKS